MGRIVNCENCNGHYIVKTGQYGDFAGCSNFPTCKSTKSIDYLVLKFIEEFGVNIYSWNRKCYKCGKETRVYSYFLSYDLSEIDEYFQMCFDNVGLGDIRAIDVELQDKIPTIKECYSKTINQRYIANTCEHCGALQGKNYVVDDPHEIFSDLNYNKNMKKYLFANLTMKDVSVIAKDIKRLYVYNE